MALFRPSKNEAQKTKLILGGVVVSIMLMAYQNCGKVGSNDSVHTSIEQKPALMAVADSSEITLLKNNENFEINAYDVNIVSGVVERTLYEVPQEDPSNAPVLLCLSNEQRQALENAIQSAKVCYYKTASPDSACTQQYIYPYAIVSGQNRIYKLGENAKPCNDFFDLCKDTREEFLSVINAILANIDQATCN